MKTIAHLKCAFKTKFGIPRQSGLVPETHATVIFESEFKNADALRGLDTYSHIWLIWEFSEAVRGDWNATVRPPRLGGNTRLGVFATRSPFRPNPIGLSCVKLEKIEFNTTQGPVLHVSGADLMDGTPIYDIKPYVPYADLIPDAVGGIADVAPERTLKVEMPENLPEDFPVESIEELKAILACDPRPAYQDDPNRVYGLSYSKFDVRFSVSGKRLTVIEIIGSNNQ